MLYRVFPAVPGAPARDPGGALYVPRLDQGRGRHDNPRAYGAMYFGRAAISPVAELLRHFLGQPVTPRHLRSEGHAYALGAIDEGRLGDLIDLDDPLELAPRGLRPSGVASRNREPTQEMALGLYREGAPGFRWWSTIEASWINVTLFDDRALPHLRVSGEPETLTVDLPVVRAAADAVGVRLAAR